MAKATSKPCDALHAPEIRVTLRATLRANDPTAALFDELPLCRGEGRADLAEINGALSGFEIKSGRDTLARLPQQIPLYETLFDYCAIVVTRRHLAGVRRIVPDKWGIYLFELRDDQALIRRVRQARQNLGTDIAAQIRLLWKTEAVRVLREIGRPINPKVSVLRIWEALENAPRQAVADQIRNALKARAMQPPAGP